ncbi:hypothetical protein BJ508DRAFT_329647 [Ascobolus immersus RN42]|uniref:Uncharacterized protein n=1 Tax=Ascobolus immersus RN42 TaxID=1160509 RepID=A0A3N4I1L8_ASCIM|nr:hypothetical protein BJ508DRAFT_329647 [Ascobolus immersus RN42]
MSQSLPTTTTFHLDLRRLMGPGLNNIAQSFNYQFSSPELPKMRQELLDFLASSIDPTLLYEHPAVRTQIRIDGGKWRKRRPQEKITLSTVLALSRMDSSQSLKQTVEETAPLFDVAVDYDTDEETYRLLTMDTEDLSVKLNNDLVTWKTRFPNCTEDNQTLRVLQVRQEARIDVVAQQSVNALKLGANANVRAKHALQLATNAGKLSVQTQKKLETFSLKITEDVDTLRASQETQNATLQDEVKRLWELFEREKRKLSLIAFGYSNRNERGRYNASIWDDAQALLNTLGYEDFSAIDTFTDVQRSETLAKGAVPPIPLHRFDCRSTFFRNQLLMNYNTYRDQYTAAHPGQRVPIILKKNFTAKQRLENSITQAKVNLLRQRYNLPYKRRDNGVIILDGPNGSSKVDQATLDKLTKDDIVKELQRMDLQSNMTNEEAEEMMQRDEPPQRRPLGTGSNRAHLGSRGNRASSTPAGQPPQNKHQITPPAPTSPTKKLASVNTRQNLQRPKSFNFGGGDLPNPFTSGPSFPARPASGASGLFGPSQKSAPTGFLPGPMPPPSGLFGTRKPTTPPPAETPKITPAPAQTASPAASPPRAGRRNRRRHQPSLSSDDFEHHEDGGPSNDTDTQMGQDDDQDSAENGPDHLDEDEKMLETDGADFNADLTQITDPKDDGSPPRSPRVPETQP